MPNDKQQSFQVTDDEIGNARTFHVCAYGYASQAVGPGFSGYSASACIVREIPGYDDPENPKIYHSREAIRFQWEATIMALVAVAEDLPIPEGSIIKAEICDEQILEEGITVAMENDPRWKRLGTALGRRHLALAPTIVCEETASPEMRRLMETVWRQVNERVHECVKQGNTEQMLRQTVPGPNAFYDWGNNDDEAEDETD